jgi:hypothetical protein
MLQRHASCGEWKEERLTKARVTQILKLLNLAPEIQEYLTHLTDERQLRYFTERKLRKISQK